MVSYSILAGGYTSFITSLLFTPPTATVNGTLAVTGTYQAGNSPSWIERSPVNSSILYATNEVSSGAFLSLLIGTDGGLTEVQSISSGGNGPAFAMPLADGNEAVVLNYNSGNGEFITLDPDLVHFTNDNGAPQQVTFTPPQGGQSHPHFALQYNNNKEVFIVDLGSDMVWRFSKPSTTSPYALTGTIPQPTGSGPRRAVIIDSTIYILHELQNTLTQQTIPSSPTSTSSSAAPIESVFSIVPSDVVSPANASYHAGELLSPVANSVFPTRYLYASNRNTGTPGPEGDSIAIFTMNPLRLVGQVYTGLSQIRGMMFGGPSDEYLIAAGLVGGGIAVFERTDGGAGLSVVARSTSQDNNSGNLEQRSTFVWL